MSSQVLLAANPHSLVNANGYIARRLVCLYVLVAFILETHTIKNKVACPEGRAAASC